MRQKYSKFSNVIMTEKYYPLLGDSVLMKKWVSKKKAKVQHYINEAIGNTNWDLRLCQFGHNNLIHLVSVEALEEFEKLLPDYVDRDEHKGRPAANFLPNSFTLRKSDENWKQRRKEIVSSMNINNCSKYIGMMIDIVDSKIDEYSDKGEVDITQMLSKIAFLIIFKIFFGQDILEKVSKCKYIDPSTGEEKMLPYDEMHMKNILNEFANYVEIKGKIFPFLANWKLIEPYKSCAKNIKEVIRISEEFCENSRDKDSYYHTSMKTGNFTKAEWVMDCITMLIAGYETTARSLTSILYLLKRHPKIHTKLKEELNNAGLFDLENKTNKDLYRAYNECDYLYYVFREALRFDHPLPQGMVYGVQKDIEICGVPISKGEKIAINHIFQSYDPHNYQRPLEFIPERFDPTSDLFFKPGGTKEQRPPKSNTPFSLGLRNCAGQTLAKLEVKVILTRLLQKIDYEVNEDIISNPDVKFNIVDGTHLKGKIINKG